MVTTRVHDHIVGIHYRLKWQSVGIDHTILYRYPVAPRLIDLLATAVIQLIALVKVHTAVSHCEMCHRLDVKSEILNVLSFQWFKSQAK